MKYRELLEWGKSFLKEKHIDEYENDAWLLFEKVFSLNRTKYYLVQCEEIGNAMTSYAGRYKDYIKRRAGNEPLQYITGEQNFMGYDFIVTPDVLIPRFDTEVLVEKVFDYIVLHKSQLKDDSVKILDMCTGSGCIAISLALLVRKADMNIEVIGADISDKALAVASENAEKLHAENVRFIRSDLFEDIPESRFDIIVSNPPYIESSVIETLAAEVKDYEPRSALDGMTDGLDFYRRIVKASGAYLNSGGRIFFEIGCEQGEKVSKLLAEAGFVNVMIIKDLTGLNRVVTARKE